MSDGRDALTRAEAARELGVSLRTVDNYIRQRHPHCFREITVGRRVGVFIERSEIERFRRSVKALVGPHARRT